MTFLIDTDWLINALHDEGAALDVLEALADRGLAVNIVSLGEIYEGVLGRPNEDANVDIINRFVRKYDILGFTDSIMLTYARVRKTLRRQGQPLEDIDLLIAATAIASNLVLITRNHRHFDRVPGLRLY